MITNMLTIRLRLKVRVRVRVMVRGLELDQDKQGPRLGQTRLVQMGGR